MLLQFEDVYYRATVYKHCELWQICSVFERTIFD